MEEKQNIIELTEAEILAALRIVLKRQRRMHWDAQAKAPIKSDAFRQLEKAGKLNAEFFLEEAGRIMARTSTLSSKQRAYVSAIMDEAAKEAVRRAMNGEDYSQGAIGFFNRRLAKKSTATWFDSALRFILKHVEVEYFGFK